MPSYIVWLIYIQHSGPSPAGIPSSLVNSWLLMDYTAMYVQLNYTDVPVYVVRLMSCTTTVRDHHHQPKLNPSTIAICRTGSHQGYQL